MTNNILRLLFAGDIIPEKDSTIDNKLSDFIKESDFACVNLESVITSSDSRIVKNGRHFKSPIQSADLVKNAGFDLACLSNNHIRDFGDKGIADTLNALHNSGINSVGAANNQDEARRPFSTEIKDKKISILNYSEEEFNAATQDQAGANIFDPINAYNDISKIKAENDLCIVVYHGGIEYQPYPTAQMVKNLEYLIDIGADAVMCHHTHNISGYKIYKGKPLVFGLGNFISTTKGTINQAWLEGLMAEIIIENDIIKLELHPIIQSEDCKSVSFADKGQSEDILKKVNEYSSNIDKDGFLDSYWEKEYEKYKNTFFNLISSGHKRAYQIRKRVPFLSGKIKVFQAKNHINTLRCESHRGRAIYLLTKETNRKN